MSAGLAAAIPGGRELRVEVRPRWPFLLPRGGGMDGLLRSHNGVLHRLLHVGDVPVCVRMAQISSHRVLFGARATDPAAAEWAIERMRCALGIDQDLRPFYERFRSDPLIGRGVRSDPGLRVAGRPEPFEALAWAICEQLIEYERAAAIERRLIARLGRRCPHTGLRDAPSAATLAAQAPALLASFDLAPKRALTLIRVAREVATGRIDLHAGDHERGWRRLRAISGVGSWTLQTLGLLGQGRMDQIPAGDLAYIKLVGRLRGEDPRARASQEEVERFFAPYAPWSGLAGLHALRSAGSAGSRRLAA